MRLMQLVEGAPRVRPAGRLPNAFSVKMTEAGVGVGLQNAAEWRQMVARALAAPVGRIAKEHRRGLFTSCRPVIAHVRPQPAGLGPPAPRIEHRHWGVIGMQLPRRHHIAGQRLEQRIDQPETPAYPFGHRRTLELYAFASVDLRLAIQRQVIGILRNQDVGEQSRAGETALDRARGRRELHNAFTFRARQLRAYVLDHPEARRNVIQNLRDVLANLAHRRPAVGTRARGRMFNAGARQVLRQRAAHRHLRGGLA
jgi:hypothetical protein